MEIIDLSRELFHRTQTHPSHPPVIMTVWNDHSEKKVAGDTVFTSKALSIVLSDHAGTYVDAPVHFDPRPGALSIDQVPLANFITSAFCIDLSHVPLKHAASVAEVEAAVKQSGQDIRKGDTVLILLGTNRHIHPRRSSGQRNLRPDLRKALAFLETDLRTAKRPWRQFGRVGTTPARDGPSRMSAAKFSPSSPPRPAGARGDQVQILPARNAPHAT
jgi:kynurenine formamidase